MTHKIKVQMFGNFRMDYNGAPFVAEKMHKESQFNRMMQALIHYSDCGIAKDKLEEIVIGERDIDAPHTALRVIVYKTKQKLAQLGLPGKNLIYLEGGIYYWTPDIEIEEDAAEFEKLYNEACALEKQMPQEPESAETVCDERIKEIEDNMLELYVKALYLYKGEFLAAYTGETWIAQEARRYHTMFEKIINEAAYILRKRKQFKGLEKIGVYAAKVDPFNEWEELIMEAMVETRRYDEAEELYTDVVDYYLRECGIYPSSRLLEILEKYSNQMNHAHEILENIQEGMNEQEETERGGYFCSYPVFKGIYQASIRIMKRTRVPVYLMLCTLEDEEDRQVQSETKINKYSRQLKKCVGESIRYSDIYICFGIHDKDGNYSVWAGTTMQSIVENTKAPIVFHILHDDTLNEINKNKLSFIADNSGNDIEFHHFNSDVFGTFADSMNRFAIGTMFRIMLPDIMPDLKKIIYLDSDLFVNTDIEELWNLNIDNYCLAAAQDCSTIRNWGTPYAVAAGQTSRDRYFNAGVLCMNLDNIRKNGSLFQQVIDYLNDNPRTWLPDQDALNAIFSGKTLLIDEKWNYFIDEARKNNEKAEKKIYHYAATLLMLHTNNEIDRAYYFTILRTPWGEQMEDGLLCNSMGRIVDRTGMLEKLLKKVTQNNIRLVFYGGENSSIRNAMRLLNRNFDSCEWHEHLKENEIICDDNTVYIVSAEADDGNGLEILANAGLENGENYFITQRFLHYTEGGFAL